MITDVTWFIACDCAVDGVTLPGGLARSELSGEAIRLARMLHAAVPDE